MLIDNFFDEVWSQTNINKCKIYDYLDYTAISNCDANESKTDFDRNADKV